MARPRASEWKRGSRVVVVSSARRAARRPRRSVRRGADDLRLSRPVKNGALVRHFHREFPSERGRRIGAHSATDGPHSGDLAASTPRPPARARLWRDATRPIHALCAVRPAALHRVRPRIHGENHPMSAALNAHTCARALEVALEANRRGRSRVDGRRHAVSRAPPGLYKTCDQLRPGKKISSSAAASWRQRARSRTSRG